MGLLITLVLIALGVAGAAFMVNAFRAGLALGTRKETAQLREELRQLREDYADAVIEEDQRR